MYKNATTLRSPSEYIIPVYCCIQREIIIRQRPAKIPSLRYQRFTDHVARNPQRRFLSSVGCRKCVRIEPCVLSPAHGGTIRHFRLSGRKDVRAFGELKTRGSAVPSLPGTFTRISRISDRPRRVAGPFTGPALRPRRGHSPSRPAATTTTTKMTTNVYRPPTTTNRVSGVVQSRSSVGGARAGPRRR